MWNPCFELRIGIILTDLYLNLDLHEHEILAHHIVKKENYTIVGHLVKPRFNWFVYLKHKGI